MGGKLNWINYELMIKLTGGCKPRGLVGTSGILEQGDQLTLCDPYEWAHAVLPLTESYTGLAVAASPDGPCHFQQSVNQVPSN